MSNDYWKFRSKITCSHCGQKVSDFGYSNAPIYKYMRDNNLCFSCAKWMELAENRPENLEVIGGIAYNVLPFQEPNNPIFRRAAEKNTKYIAKKDGTGIKSNQILLIGKVPDSFLHLFPNTGWWLPEKMGKRLVRENFHCTCRGCMDRYHCFRYDYTQEFDKEPFNVVPRDWIVGDERCTSFINITKIPNFDGYVDINDILYEKDSKEDNRR